MREYEVLFVLVWVFFKHHYCWWLKTKPQWPKAIWSSLFSCITASVLQTLHHLGVVSCLWYTSAVSSSVPWLIRWSHHNLLICFLTLISFLSSSFSARYIHRHPHGSLMTPVVIIYISQLPIILLGQHDLFLHARTPFVQTEMSSVFPQVTFIPSDIRWIQRVLSWGKICLNGVHKPHFGNSHKNSSWTIKPQNSTALKDVLNIKLLISEVLLAPVL